MRDLSASDTRIPPAVFNGVAYQGRRISIRHRSGAVVYLISEADLRLLEALEDRLDLAEAREALARHEAAGRRTVPLDEMEPRPGE